MQEVKFSITGGTMEVEKRSFTKAMLMKDDLLKMAIFGVQKETLLKNLPTINKAAEWVIIDYNKSDEILLEASGYELFKAMKDQYKGKIRGIVTIKMSYLGYLRPTMYKKDIAMILTFVDNFGIV